LVGGCVRDSLLAQLAGPAAPGSWRAKDWDVATDAMPEQVMRVFRKVIPTGIEHGTVTVLLRDTQVEVTTLRTERGYRDGRRPDQVDFVSSIDEDLARRDFTVNAIAFDPDAEELIDPFGGMSDLLARRLRAVGDPAQRFAEDGLRVLRAARFVAALDFELEPMTALAIRPSLGSYRQVSAERIHDEWNKTLRSRRPSRGFRVMQEHGLLEITAPALAALANRPRGASDQLSLAFARSDHAPLDLELRLAALTRDLDPTPARAAELADELLAALRYSNAERKTVQRFLRAPAPELQRDPSGPELRRWLRSVGTDLYPRFCALLQADVRARAEIAQTTLEAAPALAEALLALDRFEAGAAAEVARRPALSLAELSVDGKRLMNELGLRPSPALGKLLGELLELVIEEPARSSPEALLERARTLAAEPAR
jgi:tRNA nucleotidyltransferase (CCA-adding enzyme)